METYNWIKGNLVGKGEVLDIGQAWERQVDDLDVQEACQGVLIPYSKYKASHDLIAVDDVREELRKRAELKGAKP